MIIQRKVDLYNLVNEALLCIETVYFGRHKEARPEDMTEVLAAQIVECITGYAQTRQELSDECDSISNAIYDSAALVWSIENGDEDQ